MFRIYRAADAIEAQLLCDWLRAARLDAVVLGRYQSGGAGELPALTFPEVWVRDADPARARRHLRDWLRRRAAEAEGAPWRCACGTEVEAGFDLCWRCGAGRPE